MQNIDWKTVLLPEQPPLEIIVRGSIVYLAIFLLLRFTLKRESGVLGITDMLVVVLIADASQNAMAGPYRSVADGLLLVGVIVGWDFLLQWLAFRNQFIRRLISPPPLPLIRNGQKLLQNMRRESITEDELLSQLRHSGISNIQQVRTAFLESDGRISAITRKPHPNRNKRPRIS